jgi:hypothetical protein
MPPIIVVSALFGVIGVMFCPSSVVAGFSRASLIGTGVGVVARRVGIVTMPCRMIGVVVAGFSVAGPCICILTVVVGMVAVLGSMPILSRGGCRKK